MDFRGKLCASQAEFGDRVLQYCFTAKRFIYPLSIIVNLERKTDLLVPGIIIIYLPLKGGETKKVP